MRLVHRHRAEAPLPQMPRHPQPGVDVPGIVAMDMAKSPPEPILVARHGDDVNMVGHQTIAPDRHLRPRRCFGQQIEIERIIAVLEEGLLAPVAALGDVMRQARKDHAGKARHCLRLAAAAKE